MRNISNDISSDLHAFQLHSQHEGSDWRGQPRIFTTFGCTCDMYPTNMITSDTKLEGQQKARRAHQQHRDRLGDQ